MLDHALDLKADLRARSRPQTVDRVDALNDYVLLPYALTAFGRWHFNDRMEPERLAEEVVRLVGPFAVALWASHPGPNPEPPSCSSSTSRSVSPVYLATWACRSRRRASSRSCSALCIALWCSSRQLDGA